MAYKKISKKTLMKSFHHWYYGNLTCFSQEHMQTFGYLTSMLPIVEELYDKKQDQEEAMKTYTAFFNTEPQIGSVVVGITASLEEARANGAEGIDSETINGLRAGLMGPLAGVGDPLFWGTVRPVLAALGAGIAMSGSILGPIIFFIAINSIRLTTKWYLLDYGYSKGNKIIRDMAGDRIRKLTQGAAIIGLFMMGALVCKWTTIDIPIVVTKIKGKTTTVQNILDSVMPGLLALILTLLVLWLLKKGVNPLLIIVVIFIIGILGKYLGFLK